MFSALVKGVGVGVGGSGLKSDLKKKNTSNWIRGCMPVLLVVISPTAKWIWWCMQVYEDVSVVSWFGPVLFGSNDLRQFFGCQTTYLIPSQVSRNESLRHYTVSKPASRLSNILMPSAKLRNANLSFYLRLLVWRVRGSNPGLPHPEQTL